MTVGRQNHQERRSYTAQRVDLSVGLRRGCFLGEGACGATSEGEEGALRYESFSELVIIERMAVA